MDCQTAGRLLDDYIEQALSTSDRVGLVAHLQICECCRRQLAVARRLEAALATVPIQNPPEHFTQQVIARSNRRAAARKWWRIAVQTFAYSATIAAIALGLRDVRSAIDWGRLGLSPITVPAPSESPTGIGLPEAAWKSIEELRLPDVSGLLRVPDISDLGLAHIGVGFACLSVLLAIGLASASLTRARAILP